MPFLKRFHAQTVGRAVGRGGLGATRAQTRVKNPSSPGTYFFLTILFLYVSVSASLMRMVGWRYGGGGSEIEKLHPATYLFCMLIVWILMFERNLARKIARSAMRDLSLILFAGVAGATAMFAILSKGYSITPFIETFGVTVAVFMIFVTLSPQKLRLFRLFIDVFAVVNIVLVLVEYVTHRNLLPLYVYSTVSGTEQPVLDAGRPAGLLGHPLSAGGFFCLYFIVNIIRSISGSAREWARPVLGSISLFAAAMTGARAALLSSIVVVLIPAGYVFVKSFFNGLSMRATFYMIVLGGAAFVAAVVAAEYGLFDLILTRFENDQGSALSRSYALQILMNLPSEYLWYGGPPDYIVQQQQIYNVLAIEISWVNFIIACGLLFTIPLFVTYVLFLFRSIARRAEFGYAPCLYLLIVHSAALGLWAKSTSFATGVAIILAYIGHGALSKAAGRTYARASQPGVGPSRLGRLGYREFGRG